MSIKSYLQNAALKALGLSQLAQQFLNGSDISEGTPERPNYPYKQVELVFACVTKLITSLTSLPLVLSTTDEKIIESGPAYDLLFNSKLTFQEFITQTVGHYALSRDVFWYFVTEGTRIKEIQVVSGTQMRPITSDNTAGGNLIGWEYINGSHRTNLALFEVHQIKNFNPYDKFHGLGPTSAARLSISQAYQGALYNESALANGAEPGPIITLDGNPDEKVVRAFLDNFESRHGGAKNVKKACALSGVKDVKTIAFSMVDLQMLELRNMNDLRICTAFGVPPGVVGLITEAQYSHGPAQQEYIINSVIPLANLIAGNITTGIISRMDSGSSAAVEPAKTKSLNFRSNSALKINKTFREAKLKAVQRQQKVFGWFDFSENPIIQEMNRDISEKVLKSATAGVPLNALIVAHDLPYETVPWGDDWWIGMGQVPAKFTLEAGAQGAADVSLPEGGDEEEPSPAEPKKSVDSVKSAVAEIEKADEAQRLRIWQNWVISWAGIEREYKEALRVYFIRQQRELLEKLSAAMSAKKTISNKAESDEVIARVVFDLKKENGKLQVINQTFFEKASELGIRQVAAETGISGEALGKFVETAKRSTAIRHALAVQAQLITGINKTTQNKIANQLKTGLESGEGLNGLTNRIKEVLGSNRQRALSIARTQTAGAIGSGRHVGMKDAGIELKIWLTSGDENVRQAHRDAGKRYAKGIPLDEPFIIGGDFLMHPAAAGGSPANVINCRCVELAAKASGKELTLTHYANLKFVNYEEVKNG